MYRYPRNFCYVLMVLCGLGVMSQQGVLAQEVLHLYGPLGTNPAIEEAAIAYAARNNVKIEVVSGPADGWRALARENGDLVFCTGEFIMSDFAREEGLPVDKATTRPLFVRPSFMLVRPGNPKDVRDFPDLLRPGMKVMLVNGSEQTGLWENLTGKLQSLQNLVALEKNIAVCAASPEEAITLWKERDDLDAWVAWNVWHVPRRDVAQIVEMSDDYLIYRKCSVSLTGRSRLNPTAAGFVDYLASKEGEGIFGSWGWMQPPADANPALADNGVFLACRFAQDDWANNVGRGLKRIRRLVNDYRCLGVPPEEIHICAVFDAKAGYWMLKDEPYNGFTGRDAGNPNRSIVEELAAMGVDLELSARTMSEHGWTQDDILPGITIVPDAITRLADLGRRGYDFLPF